MCAFPDLEVYRDILERLPTGVCVLDLQKRIVLWSDGAERITGRRRHEVVGHACVGEPLLHCDHQDCEWCSEDCLLAQAMKTSHPANAIGFLYHKAGYEIPVRARAVPVRNARGAILGAVEVFEEQQQPTLDHREESLNFPGCMDELTSVASRTMMQSHLREGLGTFAEIQVPFAVLLFRVEGLAHFRTSSGPDAVGALLRMIARTLESALLRTDFVGRWAEDQFLVILNGCRDESLQAVRERLRRMLASDGIEWWGERRSLPVSIGGATVQPGDSIESLLARAQQSLETASTSRIRAANASAGS